MGFIHLALIIMRLVVIHIDLNRLCYIQKVLLGKRWGDVVVLTLFTLIVVLTLTSMLALINI